MNEYLISYSYKDIKGAFHYPFEADSNTEALQLAKRMASGTNKATLFMFNKDNKIIIAEKTKGFIWKYAR